MKRLLFTFVSFSMLAFPLAAEETTEKGKEIKVDTGETLKKDGEKKKLELDKENTFKGDGNKKLEFDKDAFKSDGGKKLEFNKDALKSDGKKFDFDSSSTFDKGSSSKSSFKFDTDSTFSGSGSPSAAAGTTAQNIKERLQKNPEKAKILQARAADVEKLIKAAEASKDPDTIKACTDFAENLKTMAAFYAGQEVPNDKLFKAYNDCLDIEKEITRLKLRVNAAWSNTPEARKTREFQRSAVNDRNRAELAAQQGFKAKAEYYNTRARLKTQAVAAYAQDPQAEELCNAGLKAAWEKYQMDDAQESAARFRERAKAARNGGNNADAEYYEKVALLKEKLYNAYKNNAQDAVKSILMEYDKMRSGKQ